MHMDSRVDIGMVAPDLSVETEGGRRVSLREFRGRPVVLAFVPRQWDPWRTHQLAHFQRLARELTIPLFGDLDPDGAIAALYGVRGEWAVFLVDAAGTVVWRQTGSGSPVPRLEDLVNSLTNSPARAAPPYDGTPPTRREFLTAALAAACVFALRPFVARAESVTAETANPALHCRPLSSVPAEVFAAPASVDIAPL